MTMIYDYVYECGQLLILPGTYHTAILSLITKKRPPPRGGVNKRTHGCLLSVCRSIVSVLTQWGATLVIKLREREREREIGTRDQSCSQMRGSKPAGFGSTGE